MVLLTACQELPRYFSGDEVVARADDAELLRRDVEQVMPQGLSGEDSLAFVQVYIERWVHRRLKLHEAEQLFSSSADDIDRMVEEYRQSLLIRKLDQLYVDRLIDTTFTDEQIADYYSRHKADFRLDHIIVKGRIVRVPEHYRQLSHLKTLMGAAGERQQQDFLDICAKNSFELYDLSGEWVDFSEFLGILPTLRSESYERLLGTSAVQQMDSRDARYLFQITSTLREGDPIPLERLRPTIRRILFNSRQNEIIRAHEENLMRNAVEERRVRIPAMEMSQQDTITTN